VVDSQERKSGRGVKSGGPTQLAAGLAKVRGKLRQYNHSLPYTRSFATPATAKLPFTRQPVFTMILR
jgi:hypothetical protein